MNINRFYLSIFDRSDIMDVYTRKILKVALFIFFQLTFLSLEAKDDSDCNFNNKNPCLLISKTPNSSKISEKNVEKFIISKQYINNSGAVDSVDILNSISGLDVFQSGSKGQTTSVFLRGSESNHTLALLNGIAINDQSVTDGLHDFGQDFIQSFQQVEIFKGSNGAHFGPGAIAGAVNFITDIDYENFFSFSGKDKENFLFDYNKSKITDKGWHLNLNATSNSKKTVSSIAKGNEKDKVENFQVNLNSIKWLNDNLKFKSTLYTRETVADYDGSSSDEIGYKSNNKMYALQTGLSHVTNVSNNDLILHYHNYDRKYDDSGFLDEYNSHALLTKFENQSSINDYISLGYGTEYKYDWGNFENRGSYNASTRGHAKNFGIFGNLGIDINNNNNFSIFLRNDNHNITNSNQLYKISYTKKLGSVALNAVHSTGLRNPTLYELYGSDNYGIKGNIELDAERSKTNELTAKFSIFEGLTLKSTAYDTIIFDRIEPNTAYSKHENLRSDFTQKGLENELILMNKNQQLSLFANFSKSRNDKGQSQNRRPDLAYGLNLFQDIESDKFGKLKLNINYKHTGKYTDWDGSSNTKQKSVDLINTSIIKKINEVDLILKLDNLLDENYEKPALYSKDGREFSIKFRKNL